MGATNLDDESLLKWVVPSLHTLATNCLERVILGACFEDEDAVCAALRTLDDALIEGLSSRTLQRVEVYGWNLASHWMRSTDYR